MGQNKELQRHQNFILHIINQLLIEVKSINFEDFQRNEQLKERVYTQLQEIGQASNEILTLPNVNIENRNIYENMANLRNARYNQETEIDHSFVWNILTSDLPEIEILLERTIEPVEED